MEGERSSSATLAVILAGPNGAGKSTFFKQYCERLYPGMVFINADRIETELREAGTVVSAYDAAIEAERRRREAMRSRRSFISETVFSHPSKLQLMHDLRALSYTIELHVIQLDSPDLAVARVKQRVEAGGHSVPEEKIRTRFERTAALTLRAEQLANRAYVWDNSDPTRPFRKVRSIS